MIPGGAMKRYLKMKRYMAVLLALCLALGMGALAEAEPAPQATEAPAEGEAAQPAGYVRVTTAAQSGWLPLPTEGEQVFPLSQLLPDGTEALNVIHLLPDGVYMEDATCENHDCVDQGTVTLENRQERILSNMIICLPNQVVLELYSAEEAMAILGAEMNEGE